MNLIVLFSEDFVSSRQVRVSGRRQQHILNIHRATVGKKLTVGVLNGQVGEGVVTQVTADYLELDVTLNSASPAPLPVTLIMALPRPNVFKRTLITATSMGIKKIIVLNFNRVDKSLWQSSALAPEVIQEQLVLGLEQAKDTVLPHVLLRKGFKPFVEDELPAMSAGAQLLVAHPSASSPCPRKINSSVVLVLGPEGGLVPYELEKLVAIGFQPVSLGERILRVEAALPALVAALFY